MGYVFFVSFYRWKVGIGTQQLNWAWVQAWPPLRTCNLWNAAGCQHFPGPDSFGLWATSFKCVGSLPFVFLSVAFWQTQRHVFKSWHCHLLAVRSGQVCSLLSLSFLSVKGRTFYTGRPPASLSPLLRPLECEFPEERLLFFILKNIFIT